MSASSFSFASSPTFEGRTHSRLGGAKTSRTFSRSTLNSHASLADSRMSSATLNQSFASSRDPKFWSPEKEEGWVTRSPKWEQYIPEYGQAPELSCMSQCEEYVRRPTTLDAWLVSRSNGPRVSPLLSYSSIGWNRRNYEPVAQRQPASARRMPPLPPRIHSIDNRSRPAMVVHSTGMDGRAGRPRGARWQNGASRAGSAL